MDEINGKSYMIIVDEGFSDSWIEQIVEGLGATPDTAVYLRTTDRPEDVIASLQPLTDEEFKEITKVEEDDY